MVEQLADDEQLPSASGGELGEQMVSYRPRVDRPCGGQRLTPFRGDAHDDHLGVCRSSGGEGNGRVPTSPGPEKATGDDRDDPET